MQHHGLSSQIIYIPGCWFSPPVLIIPEGSSGLLTCTAVSRPNNIEAVDFIQSRSRTDILRHIHQVGNYSIWLDFVQEEYHSSFYLNITWTSDPLIRRELDMIQCVVIYATSSVCITARVMIIFQDQNAGIYAIKAIVYG